MAIKISKIRPISYSFLWEHVSCYVFEHWMTCLVIDQLLICHYMPGYFTVKLFFFFKLIFIQTNLWKSLEGYEQMVWWPSAVVIIQIGWLKSLRSPQFHQHHACWWSGTIMCQGICRHSEDQSLKLKKKKKRLWVLMHWISNHKHKINKNVPVFLQSCQPRTGTNFQH